MMTLQRKKNGFTLLEMLLVLAIASSLVVLMLNYTTQKSDELRRDKTVMQMQQILTAGMSFYVSNAFWPLAGATVTNTMCGTWTATTTLKPNYIPTSLTNNPYANPYMISCNSPANGNGFFVYTTVNNAVNASIIAGRLPLAYITNTTTGVPPTQPAACQNPATASTCTTVVASVNIPGQNLNNARSINFANVYSSGACVPAPNCPANMKPAIFVAPASVAGITDNPSCSSSTNPASCTNVATHPVTSFSAFARGDSSGNPVTSNPLDCATSAAASAYACNLAGNASDPAGTKYWRVCLSVYTENGAAYPQSAYSNAANMGFLIGKILAVTRCVPNNGAEAPSGSPVTVWSPNNSWTP